MHPYRPLHAATTDLTPSHADRELRGLAVVLIILGMLRLLPALASHEAFGAETVVALAMLALGVLEVTSLRRRLHRWRRIHRRRRASAEIVTRS